MFGNIIFWKLVNNKETEKTGGKNLPPVFFPLYIKITGIELS